MAIEMAQAVFLQIWQVWLDTALWLCLGLVFAAAAHVYLRTEHLQRWLADSGPRSVLRASLLGAPLPLCSCGVLPAAIGLRRAGASKEASAAFLISTPETGVDSIAVSYALLGPVYAVLRPLAALLTAFAAGLAVWRWGDDKPVAESAAETSCCGGHANEESAAPDGGIWAGLRYAFSDLLSDLAGWLVFGVVLAGVILALVPPNLIAELGQSSWALVIMLLVGVPIYVCAVASTPIAAALLVAGVSPGAVLVFLLAGPATNLGGLALIRNEFGTRFVACYLGAICVVSLTLGWLIDAVAPLAWFGYSAELVAHHESGSLLSMIAAVALGVWLLCLQFLAFQRRR
jgi:uncharacterized membrane protein YraQ (UPF0718 family)